jgi:cyclopropane fatty-acyl-phospholipid synthase-like methyltransferase
MNHNINRDLYTPLSTILNLQNLSILDWGGSKGNLIRSSNGKILSSNYTSVDVDLEAITLGKKDYPEADWIYLDLYSPMYNAAGNADIQLPKKYDIIFSFSIFSHTTFEYFIETIDTLKTYLTPNGKIYVSMISQEDKLLLNTFKTRRAARYGSCDDFINNDSYFYLVDNKIEEEVPLQCEYLLTVYNEEFLAKYGKIHRTNLPQLILELNI